MESIPDQEPTVEVHESDGELVVPSGRLTDEELEQLGRETRRGPKPVH
jgi:hypothetical protein